MLSVCVCVSYLLQSCRYLLALQQVSRLHVAAYWRSLDVQLQLRLWLLLHQQLLPQLLHHLLLHGGEDGRGWKGRRRGEEVKRRQTKTKCSQQ